MSDAEYKEYEKKCRAKSAVDTIMQAEAHKKDKEISKHIKAEMKERAGHLESAMGAKKKDSKKEAPKKAAPAKKSASKKK